MALVQASLRSLACLKQADVAVASSVKQCLLRSRPPTSHTRLLATLSPAQGGSMKLEGVYPPIITNFTPEGKLDLDSFAENVKLWETVDFTGYVILGSTGESPLLTVSEKIEMVTHLRYLTDKPIIAGSGCESTYHTIQLTKEVAKAGANAVMVVTPSYYRGSMSHDALVHHYTQVADHSPVPVILYSVPPNTMLDLPVAVAVQLAKHTNIIGMKDSGGDITKFSSLVRKTRDEKFSVLAGSAGFFLAALNIGGTGGVLGLANALGPECCQLFSLFKQGKVEEAVELQHRLVAPNGVLGMFGVAGVKCAMDVQGYKGGWVRGPILPLTDQQKKRVEEILRDDGFKC